MKEQPASLAEKLVLLVAASVLVAALYDPLGPTLNLFSKEKINIHMHMIWAPLPRHNPAVFDCYPVVWMVVWMVVHLVVNIKSTN